MAKKKRQVKPPTAKERALDEIYAEIPSIPGCTGACASSCGPIAMFGLEWKRVKRAAGRTPRMREPLRCPMLSPTGKCTVYTVRPYICRLWGTTETLRCPEGCEPGRWLSREEAQSIFNRLGQIAGPEVTGPLGGVDDLWAGFALEAREQRGTIIDEVRRVNNGRDSGGSGSDS